MLEKTIHGLFWVVLSWPACGHFYMEQLFDFAYTLFINKSFEGYVMFLQKPSKFAEFLEYENPYDFFSFYYTFTISLINALV